MKHAERIALLKKIAKVKDLVKTAMQRDERTMSLLAKSLFKNMKMEGASANEMMELVGEFMDLIAEDLRTPSPVLSPAIEPRPQKSEEVG